MQPGFCWGGIELKVKVFSYERCLKRTAVDQTVQLKRISHGNLDKPPASEAIEV